MTLRLTVNGEARDVPRESTVADLLVAIQAHPEGVAVAVNGEVVPRGQRRERILADGDRVEVIRAVGGG